MTLDMGALVRQGFLLAGERRAGTLMWTNTGTGEHRASIQCDADLTYTKNAFIRLHYIADGTAMDYRVWLRRTACNLGGFRWWFICPLTGHHAVKLHLPPGAVTFACRRAYRMTYQSERSGLLERSHARLRRIHLKLGATYSTYGEGPPARPKGMHHRTYDRLIAELEAVAEQHETISTISLASILARLGVRYA